MTKLTVKVNKEISGEYVSPGLYDVEIEGKEVYFADKSTSGKTSMRVWAYKAALENGSLEIV